MVTVLIFLFVRIHSDPTPVYEELAFEYFFGTIWKQKYNGEKLVEFDRRTDSRISLGLIYGCRTWEEQFKQDFEKGRTTEVVELPSKLPNVTIRKMSDSKRLKLKIGAKVKVGDVYIIQLVVYKPLEFVDHYFLKFDLDGNIIDKCEFNEVI